MDLQPNKIDGIVLPITDTRISASEWNQLVGSCMAFINEAGLTPDASDNEQFLNAFKTIAAGLEIVGANTNLSNLTATGEARFSTKANTDLSNVPASKSILVESYVNGTSWYRVYSDGWCEQGGYAAVDDDANVTVSLLKPFKNTNYTILFGNRSSAYTGSTFGLPTCIAKSTNTFNIGGQSNGAKCNTDWIACGYIS